MRARDFLAQREHGGTGVRIQRWLCKAAARRVKQATIWSPITAIISLALVSCPLFLLFLEGACGGDP